MTLLTGEEFHLQSDQKMMILHRDYGHLLVTDIPFQLSCTY